MIGLYWRARRQSLDTCTELCTRALCCLRDNGYTTFYRLGRSRKAALSEPVEPSFDVIRAHLEKGVNRRDTDRKPIPDLGYSLSLWSGGASDESYKVSIHCGCYSQFVGNNFLLELPSSGQFSLTSSEETAFASFRDLVRIWQPEQAIVCNPHELRWDKDQLAPDMKSYLRFPELPNA
jgi:hypothetical protein